MKIFGKKEEEFDDEELDEKELDREIPSRKFKDLKPQNSRKRKEPVKPWGKKERIIIATTLGITIFASGLLAISAREWKLPGVPKIGIPKIGNLNPFREETIVIGKGAQNDTTSKETINLFREKTKNLSGNYSFYVVRLGDGFTYGDNHKEQMQAASLIKLPVFVLLYQEAEAGNIDLDSTYKLKESDKTLGSGSISGRPAGSVFTYRELAGYMGQQSDNTAFTILVNLLGGEDVVQEAIDDLGMTQTSIVENQTSPEDMGILFKKLWSGELVSTDSRDEILSSLTGTIYEEHLKKGIPNEVIAHKYGREIHVVNDAGIVLNSKPFVIVIMTGGVVEKEADSVFPELAKLIYDQEGANNDQ